ncbi:MAG: hypothetical protein AAGH19_10575 [Pseudomonadota bacterium]
MPTWRETYERLAEAERQALEKWRFDFEPGDTETLKAARESTADFLRRYKAAGHPPDDSVMPD